MRKIRSVNALCTLLISMIFIGTIAVLPINVGHGLGNDPWYVKPSYPNYAPSGVPDFDEKQDNWGPAVGTYTWCGPVAVANSLWWLDSKFDPSPLVTAYPGAPNDHAPANVDPLVRNLAFLMDTDGQRTHDGHLGTRWQDLENGTKYYIAQQGLTKYFEVHNMTFPDFGWLNNEISISQDVELFLEFYQYTPGGWIPLTSPASFEAGHFVTCAGVNGTTSQLLICDPYQDAFEAGTAPGRSPVAHAYPHGSAVHNNASYVSQDAYQASVYSFFGNPPPPPPPPPPAGYPPTVLELAGYLQTLGFPGTWHAFVRAAVATSPKEVPQWQGYVKPPYQNYAPSGVPDFDEKQDNWGPVAGMYTWCVPVSVANSLWWLDSKFDPSPLVTAYPGVLSDHNPANVDPLVRNLALLMDTDGMQSADGHTGTRFTDIQNGIQKYLIQQGTAGTFEVHNSSFPTFGWIDTEVEKCEDVVILLEFWRFTGTWQKLYDNPSLEFGHCVTCAGVNSTTSQLLVSDPYQDAFEAGTTPGRSPVIHAYPHASNIHNDAQYVSQDAYNASQWIEPPPSPYPGIPLLELVGYLQTLGYDPSWHAFITAAVATSPSGTHDVAVTGVKTAKDGCIPTATVCENYTVKINVTVTNQGTFTETFNVTDYASDLLNSYVIGKTPTTLAAGETKVLTFTWSTVGFAKGTYTISAQADQVIGETDTSDNSYTGGTVKIVIQGDVNGDGIVDIFDIARIAIVFGVQVIGIPPPNWDPNADINGDYVIDIFDIVIVALHFGESSP